jgi:pSer/pThr/pTyr-binding forkhead associated (FHA) protein
MEDKNMSWLAHKVGGAWHDVKTAFERSDVGIAGATLDADDAAILPTATRYGPIRDAVERRIAMFLRRDLVSHLEIGFNECFALHYIEIAADRSMAENPGRELLQQFLHEFSPEARIDWVKRLLGAAVQKHVTLEHFLGLDQEFAVEDLAETDPFEEELNQAAAPGYRITLHGRWEVKQEAAVVAAPPAASTPLAQSQRAETEKNGPRLCLAIRDAKSANGARTIEIESYPAVVGSSMHADVEVSGYYVSATHCTLHCDDNKILVEDHSTNGTWLDGRRLVRGQRVELSDAALLGFGRAAGAAARGVERYPELQIQQVQLDTARLDGSGRTPLAPPYQATPVAPEGGTPLVDAVSLAAGRQQAPLAVIAILDATGNPKRDILRLPYSVGRGSAQDYVVPDANAGVSREHLLIETIDERGAATVNLAIGKNGSFADGQALPERFTWRYGQEIVLAEKWSSAPVVRLVLRRVEH